MKIFLIIFGNIILLTFKGLSSGYRIRKVKSKNKKEELKENIRKALILRIHLEEEFEKSNPRTIDKFMPLKEKTLEIVELIDEGHKNKLIDYSYVSNLSSHIYKKKTYQR